MEHNTGDGGNYAPARGGVRTYMAHWTDDPRINALMKYLGRTGKTGKPTRAAYVAEQVSQIMIKVEPRVSELRIKQAEYDKLFAHYEKRKDLVDHKSRYLDGVKIEFEQAKDDLLSQNPDADISAFTKDLRDALQDVEDDYQKAIADIPALKKSITVKRTNIRSFEDRLEPFRRQVVKQMNQLVKAQQKVRQQKSA